MSLDNKLLREKRLHGTKFFPVAVYECHQKPENMIVDFHWHDEWEFLLVTQGKAMFQVGSRQQLLKPGQIMFARNRVVHGGIPLPQQSCSFRAIVFHPRFLADDTVNPVQIEYVEPFLTGKKQFPDFMLGNTAGNKKIYPLLNEIYLLCQRRMLGYELHVKGNLLLVWAALLANGDFVDASRSPQEMRRLGRLKQVLTLIHEGYQGELTIASMAESIQMSEGYFCRFFKEMMHMTPIEYVQRYRIRAAAKELSSTQKQIIEIAFLCGFCNLSYFNLVFKKYMGCTPSAYRER